MGRRDRWVERRDRWRVRWVGGGLGGCYMGGEEG